MDKNLIFRVREIRIEDQVKIFWSDGKETQISFKDLRYFCPCAACVDELTSRRMIQRTDVKTGIFPVRSEYVGNYALRIYWNDGHNTGIYTFRSLRGNF